jgi:hypothetical protein
MISMTVKLGEYKGHPTISLSKEGDDEHPFTFGLSKAKLIIANMEDIKKFIEDNPSK